MKYTELNPHWTNTLKPNFILLGINEIPENKLGNENIVNTPGVLLDTACGSGHMLAMFRSHYDSGSVAAVINFLAIHHLDLDGIRESMLEWKRVMCIKI